MLYQILNIMRYYTFEFQLLLLLHISLYWNLFPLYEIVLFNWTIMYEKFTNLNYIHSYIYIYISKYFYIENNENN